MSNRGVNRKVGKVSAEIIPAFSFTVDWISVTFDAYWGNRFARKIGYLGWASSVEGVPPKGYNKAVELETGALIAWHTEIPTQGIHVKLSGSTLRWYMTKGLDWHTLLRMIKKCHGRTSRVDLAIDIRNGGLKLEHCCEENLLPYKGKGRTPRVIPVGSQKNGWTVYVGARTSQKYLRVYDKAKEQKDMDADYVRVELECKEEIAHAIGHEFPEMSKDDCVVMAQTLIRQHAAFDQPAYLAALESRTIELSIPQGKEKDTLGWLLKIVAPSLAKQIKKYPHENVYDEFMNALRRELNDRGLDIF